VREGTDACRAIRLRVNRFFLHKEVSRLDAALEALESVNQNSAGARPKRERKPMSLSARKRTAAQRARWKKMEETKGRVISAPGLLL